MSETSQSLSITEEQAGQIFGSSHLVDPESVHQPEFTTRVGVNVRFADTRLGLKDDPGAPEERYLVTGNTVPRLCGAMGSCAANACGLADRPMSLLERQDADCAVANTAEAFDGRTGFIITPTNNEAVFMWEENSFRAVTITDERDREVTVLNKVKAASVFVFSENDISDEIFVGANNADNSFIVATTEVEGLRYALVASSSRLNLGDRESTDQIFRKGVEGILDRHELEGVDRQHVLEIMMMDIHVGYSASLKNFKHDVRLPEEGSDAANELIAANGLSSYDELTPTIVMSGKKGQYPGALDHGEVYGAFEAENDIDIPRSPAGCPGFGEYCYIHYPKITERTIVSQLADMGMRAENIVYDLENVIDPASEENRLASNRRMQLAGVPILKTLRSVNGAVISFPSRQTWEWFGEG